MNLILFAKVIVNKKALLDADLLDLPHDLVLKLTRTAPGGDQDTLALTFEVIFLSFFLSFFLVLRVCS